MIFFFLFFKMYFLSFVCVFCFVFFAPASFSLKSDYHRDLVILMLMLKAEGREAVKRIMFPCSERGWWFNQLALANN